MEKKFYLAKFKLEMRKPYSNWEVVNESSFLFESRSKAVEWVCFQTSLADEGYRNRNVRISTSIEGVGIKDVEGTV